MCASCSEKAILNKGVNARTCVDFVDIFFVFFSSTDVTTADVVVVLCVRRVQER